MSHLSSHPDNDDMRHYAFSRSSGLPVGYFKRAPRITRDGLVVVACVVAFIFAIIV